jgi:hypothetical protein
VVQANLKLVIFLPEVLIFFSEVPVCLFKVANGMFCAFDLPLQRNNLFVFLGRQLLQDD